MELGTPWVTCFKEKRSPKGFPVKQGLQEDPGAPWPGKALASYLRWGSHVVRDCPLIIPMPTPDLGSPHTFWPNVVFRGLSGLKVFDVTRTLNTTYFGRNKPKRLSKVTPFLFLILYFNNSTGKRNTANIPLLTSLCITISSSVYILAAVFYVTHNSAFIVFCVPTAFLHIPVSVGLWPPSQSL